MVQGYPLPIDPYTLSVIGFFLAIALLIYRDRKRTEFHYILVMRKTKNGEKFIKRIVAWNPRLWKTLATVGVIGSAIIMARGIYLMVESAYIVLTQPVRVPGLQFIIPVPQSQPVSGFGFLGVPFWFWVILLPFVLFPHEFAHGIASAVEKIKIKSVGLFMLAILPGAFVEPDEKQLKKARLMTKLRIFAAGSVTNIAFVLVILFVAMYILWPASMQSGLMIMEVAEGSGAEDAGLQAGMTIESMGGSEVDIEYGDFAVAYGNLLFNNFNITENTLKTVAIKWEISGKLQDYEPNDTMRIVADGRNYDVKLSGRPDDSSSPYIGVVTDFQIDENMFTVWFPLIWWITTLGELVAIFNILPLYPLDGGLIIEAVAQKYAKKHARKITIAATAVMLAILVLIFAAPPILNFLRAAA